MSRMLSFTCRAVLFDLDGTLLDSTGRIDRLWQWWAARRGIQFDALRDFIHGRTAVETIRLAAPELVPQDEIEALETEEISDMHDVHLYPGALELLKQLDGARWAIVTSGSDLVANARIGYVGLPRPPVLVTANQVQHSKPAPQAYLLAAKRLGVQPEDCIVVEDAPVGVAAGKAAGMRVIAIASTHAPDELRDADAVSDSLHDITLHTESESIVLRIRA